jgi:hypothetical protein
MYERKMPVVTKPHLGFSALGGSRKIAAKLPPTLKLAV